LQKLLCRSPIILCSTVLFLLLICQLFTPDVSAQEISSNSRPKGTIKGRVLDCETRYPLYNANILIVNEKQHTVADSNGVFIFENIPVGNYSLRISRIGYAAYIMTDVIVKPGRITYVNPKLHESEIAGKNVIVTTGYFSYNIRQPNSVINFSPEEIRRTPGIASDVSRIIGTLPGITSYDDRFNNHIVRGGNPYENGYIVDNIEIPNINHYASPGSSGGAIGFINTDLIQELNFFTGAFPAQYGNRLSSFMDVQYRSGNSEEFDGQLALDLAGGGLVAEGPLAGGRGSWLISARRGFLDVVMDLLDIDMSPTFWDMQSKLTYDFNPNSRMSMLVLTGSSQADVAKDKSHLMGGKNYGDIDSSERTVGLNWKYLAGANGYSETSVSHTHINYKLNSFWVSTGGRQYKNFTNEDVLKVRHTEHLKTAALGVLEFGGQLEYGQLDYDHFYSAYQDRSGNIIPSLQVEDNEDIFRLGLFFGSTFDVLERITINAGARVGIFSYNDNYHLSPRLSLSYRPGAKTTISFSGGIYYQNLPMLILSQNRGNLELDDPSAVHFVIGLNQLLRDDILLKVELYDKRYRNFPIDTLQPQIFMIDELIDNYGFFLRHLDLAGGGRAYSRGVECVLQKKLSGNFYGLIGASYYRARYRDHYGDWRNRMTDQRFVTSVEGGYRPNDSWELKIRWDFAGGKPYSPFDTAASIENGYVIYDEEKINSERLPDYHTLSVRIDRKFNFDHSVLTMYVSVWNLYDRDNIASYGWDARENRVDPIYQLGILPVAGLEYEF